MDSQTSSGPTASSGLTAQLTAKAPLLLGIALLLATLALYFGTWVWGGAASGVFSDFQAFWVAGRYLSGGGDAALLYEAPRFIALVSERLGYEFKLLWLYPPTVFPLAWASAQAPFGLAYGLWIALSLAIPVLAGRLLGLTWGSSLLLACFPAALHNALMGQTAALLLLFLAGGFALLDRAPRWAGVLFALTFIKPHLALLAPLYLLVGRRWEALGGLIAGLVLLLLSSLLLWGLEPWHGFFQAAAQAAELALGSAWKWTHQSVYAALRDLGAGSQAALLVHWLHAAFWVLVLVWVVAVKGAGSAQAMAVYCFASLSLSPYLLNHDLLLLALPFAFLLLLVPQGTWASLGWRAMLPLLVLWIFAARLFLDFPGPPLLLPLVAALCLPALGRAGHAKLDATRAARAFSARRAGPADKGEGK